MRFNPGAAPLPQALIDNSPVLFSDVLAGALPLRLQPGFLILAILFPRRVPRGAVPFDVLRRRVRELRSPEEAVPRRRKATILLGLRDGRGFVVLRDLGHVCVFGEDRGPAARPCAEERLEVLRRLGRGGRSRGRRSGMVRVLRRGTGVLRAVPRGGGGSAQKFFSGGDCGRGRVLHKVYTPQGGGQFGPQPDHPPSLIFLFIFIF